MDHLSWVGRSTHTCFSIVFIGRPPSKPDDGNPLAPLIPLSHMVASASQVARSASQDKRTESSNSPHSSLPPQSQRGDSWHHGVRKQDRCDHIRVKPVNDDPSIAFMFPLRGKTVMHEILLHFPARNSEGNYLNVLTQDPWACHEGRRSRPEQKKDIDQQNSPLGWLLWNYWGSVLSPFATPNQSSQSSTFPHRKI